MTLVGTLKSGARVEQIPCCEFEGSPANSPTDWSCGEPALYRVTFEDGEVIHACEYHAQGLWNHDHDEAQVLTNHHGSYDRSKP